MNLLILVLTVLLALSMMYIVKHHLLDSPFTSILASMPWGFAIVSCSYLVTAGRCQGHTAQHLVTERYVGSIQPQPPVCCPPPPHVVIVGLHNRALASWHYVLDAGSNADPAVVFPSLMICISVKARKPTNNNFLFQPDGMII